MCRTFSVWKFFDAQSSDRYNRICICKLIGILDRQLTKCRYCYGYSGSRQSAVGSLIKIFPSFACWNSVLQVESHIHNWHRQCSLQIDFWLVKNAVEGVKRYVPLSLPLSLFSPLQLYLSASCARNTNQICNASSFTTRGVAKGIAALVQNFSGPLV